MEELAKALFDTKNKNLNLSFAWLMILAITTSAITYLWRKITWKN